MKKSLLSLIGLVSMILFSTGASADTYEDESYCIDNAYYVYGCCTDTILTISTAKYICQKVL